MTWRESLAPLRERNFRFYFAARSINLFGTMMSHVALAFAVLEITDDPAALGQVLAAHTIPMVLLLLWGGVIGDRFSRARLLQFSNLTSALSQGAIAVLVITGNAEIWMLLVLSVVHGAVSAVASRHWPASCRAWWLARSSSARTPWSRWSAAAPWSSGHPSRPCWSSPSAPAGRSAWTRRPGWCRRSCSASCGSRGGPTPRGPVTAAPSPTLPPGGTTCALRPGCGSSCSPSP